MLFSEWAEITRGTDDDWFDPIIELDTPLFIDPFLIYRRNQPRFEGSREEIVEFFDHAHRLLAAAINEEDARWRKAERMLMFPEPRELRLGYASGGIAGHGSANTRRDEIVDGIRTSIDLGIERLERFEELPLFNKGVGPDTISDLTANILKHRLVTYTQEVCRRHNVMTQRVPLRHAEFDFERDRWIDDRVELPVPEGQSPVLLLPAAFLRELPIVNWNAFVDYAWQVFNEALREDFGFDIKSDIDRDAAIKIARARHDIVAGFVEEAEAHAEAYSVTRDTSGLYQPYLLATQFASANPMSLPPVNDLGGFKAFIRAIIEDYRRWIEDMNGSEAFWNDDGSPRKESAVQRSFLGHARIHCMYNDVHLVGEADLGRGPVDFEFATGFSRKAVVETKLMSNTRYWHGLESQLPTYMRANGAPYGYFLGVALRDSERGGVKWTDLPNRTARLRTSGGLDVESSPIDGRIRPSASRT